MKEREPKPKVVRPLRGGQITIPAEFRERLGVGADSLLQMKLVEGELRIRPVQVTQHAAGSAWLKELYDELAPVRKQAAGATEAEVDAAIDQAISAVRRKRA